MSPSCAGCGTELPAGAKFCAECGRPATVACPACGTVSGGGRFCAECGAALAAPSGRPVAEPSFPVPRDESASPVAERRIVSLLFADLVGFTPISEARDPEEVRELLSAYFDRARAVIERYGGTVEKFIGDAVFAVWGVPVAREDDAERAVRAGLDLTSTVTALGEELGIEALAMRVGVTTGQVAVTLGAIGEGMVAGDAVNTAARVQSVAGPGQVWVDDTTRSLTTASLAYAPMGAFELKGKSVPVALFHAVRTTGVVGGNQRVDGLEAPFVGRDRELRLVKELFHGTIEEERARLLLITGEPGVGKSRLAWEFEKYVDAIPTHTTYWMRGRCLSYGDGVAGRVVAELIRYLLRLSDTDSDETARAVLHERLAQHVADPAERGVLGPRLESLLGLTDQSFEPADLFACWRAFLESLHADGGNSVTMVIEDLQWGDEGLFDFLDHLLEASHAPIFVLALARPEVNTVRPGIGAGRRATTLFLEPLADAPMATLLDGLVASLPGQLRDELVRRAEGVPLYGVETIRALVDRDIVVPREGHYTVDTEAAAGLDLDALGPPASLQALLAARLDALPDDERRVVQDASVLGSTFTVEAMKQLAPPDIALDATLASLRQKEILTVETDPRSPERGQLRFVQALLRTVAYETLSRRDRQIRHLAVARYLSELPEHVSLASVIARHYLDAAAAMPDVPEAAHAMAEAQRLLEVAAEHAQAVGAPRNALALYERLLDLEPDDDILIRVTVRRAELAYRLGAAPDETMRRVDPAIKIAEKAGRTEDVLTLRLARGQALIMSGHPAEALADMQDIMKQCLGRPERVSLLAATVRRIALCSQALGDPATARDATQAALDDVERFGDDADFAIYLSSMSMQFGLAGYRRLTSIIRQATVPLFDTRDPAGVTALMNLVAAKFNDQPAEAWEAMVEARCREEKLGLALVPLKGHVTMLATLLGTPEVVSAARQGLEQAKTDGQGSLGDWEAYLASASAVLARHLGDPELILPAVASEESSGDPVSNGWWSMREAVAAEFAGDQVRAADLAVETVERMARLGLAHEDMPPAFSLTVDLLTAVGDTERLRALVERLETLAMGQRFRFMHGSLLRARALLSPDPVPGLRSAVDVFDAMGAALPGALTRIELAEALVAAGQPDAATGLLEAAEGVLAAIQAVPGLRRIAALRGERTVVAT